jgi:hypothetical protein
MERSSLADLGTNITIVVSEIRDALRCPPPHLYADRYATIFCTISAVEGGGSLKNNEF